MLPESIKNATGKDLVSFNAKNIAQENIDEYLFLFIDSIRRMSSEKASLIYLFSTEGYVKLCEDLVNAYKKDLEKVSESYSKEFLSDIVSGNSSSYEPLDLRSVESTIMKRIAKERLLTIV